jgi:hypothetical protein
LDDARARQMIGKHVIIGLTYRDHTGAVEEQVQLHGDIVAIDDVVTVRLSGSGEAFTLPADLDAFTPAPPGEYRFRATGEVVVNPDLMTTWTIHRPAPQA